MPLPKSKQPGQVCLLGLTWLTRLWYERGQIKTRMPSKGDIDLVDLFLFRLWSRPE